MELPILIFLVAGMLVYSFCPLFGPWRPLEGSSGDDRSRTAALEMEKTGYLKAIKDVEFERDTGKLSDADYEDLHAFYSRKAAETMTTIDAIRAEDDRADPSS